MVFIIISINQLFWNISNSIQFGLMARIAGSNPADSSSNPCMENISNTRLLVIFPMGT